MSLKPRKIDPESKMVAVLERLRGESSIADICRKQQISESLYYRLNHKQISKGGWVFPDPETGGPYLYRQHWMSGYVPGQGFLLLAFMPPGT